MANPTNDADKRAREEHEERVRKESAQVLRDRKDERDDAERGRDERVQKEKELGGYANRDHDPNHPANTTLSPDPNAPTTFAVVPDDLLTEQEKDVAGGVGPASLSEPSPGPVETMEDLGIGPRMPYPEGNPPPPSDADLANIEAARKDFAEQEPRRKEREEKAKAERERIEKERTDRNPDVRKKEPASDPFGVKKEPV